MPRLNVDYSKTTIYKIQHNDDETLLYVGSTTNFNNRKSHHKCRCNNPKDRCHNLKVYKMIRENGGWDCFSMTKIEDFPCENGRDAEAREDELMRELKANMNAQRAFIADHVAQKSVYNRRYRETHADYQRRWRQNNPNYERERRARLKREAAEAAEQ